MPRLISLQNARPHITLNQIALLGTVNLPKVRQFKTGINLLFCSK